MSVCNAPFYIRAVYVRWVAQSIVVSLRHNKRQV